MALYALEPRRRPAFPILKKIESILDSFSPLQLLGYLFRAGRIKGERKYRHFEMKLRLLNSTSHALEYCRRRDWHSSASNVSWI
jgi:hypothetical protein